MRILYEPDIKIDIIKFRPIVVFITGEVNNPGVYDMNEIKQEKTEISKITISLDNTNESKSRVSFPKLFKAIKASGGVTNYANLSKVEVIRSTLKNGGGKEAVINLLDLIIYGNQANNIYIYDDDIINIPKVKKLLKSNS